MLEATIYTKRKCPFCYKAKSLLLERGYNITEKVIGEDCSREDLLDLVPSAKTVPQIFVNQVYVGGYTELVEYFPTREINGK